MRTEKDIACSLVVALQGNASAERIVNIVNEAFAYIGFNTKASIVNDENGVSLEFVGSDEVAAMDFWKALKKCWPLGECEKEIRACARVLHHFSEKVASSRAPVPEPSPEITFSFEGRTYVCSPDAYSKDLIFLPDGTALRVMGWEETSPPRPLAFEVVGIATTAREK